MLSLTIASLCMYIEKQKLRCLALRVTFYFQDDVIFEMKTLRQS